MCLIVYRIFSYHMYICRILLFYCHIRRFYHVILLSCFYYCIFIYVIVMFVYRIFIVVLSLFIIFFICRIFSCHILTYDIVLFLFFFIRLGPGPSPI